MKTKFLIFGNMIIWVFVLAGILLISTYKQIPVYDLHLPWATDLHTYKLVEHAGTFSIGIITSLWYSIFIARLKLIED